MFSETAGMLNKERQPSISVNPHLAAFPLVAQVANNYLRDLSPDALGIIISDDNREVVDDIERFLKLLRATSGSTCSFYFL